MTKVYNKCYFKITAILMAFFMLPGLIALPGTALGDAFGLGMTVNAEEEYGETIDTRLMFRLYNPNSGEHFYTASSEERNTLKEAGWRYEGIAWKAPINKGNPVYRMYNPNAGDHHYTRSKAEKNNLVKAGWNYEGIGWYSIKESEKNKIPIYRLYNPNCTGAGAHHYTKDTAERDYLVSAGWRDEGIAWYGYDVKSVSPDGSEVVVSDIAGLDNATDNELWSGFYEGVDEIYETLKPLGYGNAAIAGFAGNAIMESALKPEIVSIYGYHGIYQFSNDFHWPRYLKYCEEKGYEVYSIQGQTMYVHEVWFDYLLKIYSKDVPMNLEIYKNLLGAADAAAAFQVGFGRGVGGTIPTRFDYSTGYKYQTMEKRCEYARQALKYINAKYGEQTADIEEIEIQVSVIQSWLSFLESLEDDPKTVNNINGAGLTEDISRNGAAITFENEEYTPEDFDKTDGVGLVAPDGTVYDDGYDYGIAVTELD